MIAHSPFNVDNNFYYYEALLLPFSSYCLPRTKKTVLPRLVKAEWENLIEINKQKQWSLQLEV